MIPLNSENSRLFFLKQELQKSYGYLQILQEKRIFLKSKLLTKIKKIKNLSITIDTKLQDQFDKYKQKTLFISLSSLFAEIQKKSALKNSITESLTIFSSLFKEKIAVEGLKTKTLKIYQEITSLQCQIFNLKQGILKFESEIYFIQKSRAKLGSFMNILI
jgi:hypothetical protein